MCINNIINSKKPNQMKNTIRSVQILAHRITYNMDIHDQISSTGDNTMIVMHQVRIKLIFCAFTYFCNIVCNVLYYSQLHTRSI